MQRGIGLLLHETGEKFAGIILLGALDTDELRAAMNSLTCPVVLLNQKIEGLQASQVEMKDYESGYRATQYLLEKGHRHIAFLNGYINAVAVADRDRGFCDAMADAGIMADEIAIAYPGMLSCNHYSRVQFRRYGRGIGQAAVGADGQTADVTADGLFFGRVVGA